MMNTTMSANLDGIRAKDDHAAYMECVIAAENEFETSDHGRQGYWNWKRCTTAAREGRGPFRWKGGTWDPAYQTGTIAASPYERPWHVIRPFLNEEFVRWVEDEGKWRMTFAEFKAQRAELREGERSKEIAYMESAQWALDQLAQLRDLLAQRDELIAIARERGAISGEVEVASGLSRMQVHRAVKSQRPDLGKVSRELQERREWERYTYPQDATAPVAVESDVIVCTCGRNCAISCIEAAF